MPASTGFTSVRSTSARPGDERVVAPVEQEQDARAGQPPARLLEPQVDRDRDTAHVADLEVEDHEVGIDAGERVAHVLPAGDLDDFLARADERRTHLIAHPLRVGGHEDRAHRAERSRRSASR